MRLNDAGRMVQDVWNDLPTFYPGVQTDAFIVMPNHIHGIVILVGAGSHACPDTPMPAPILGKRKFGDRKFGNHKIWGNHDKQIK